MGKLAEAADTPTLPEPTVVDFDAFRAKATARSKKYAAFVEKTRQKTDGAKRSAKLEWLRSGRDSGGFDTFKTGWHNELHEFEEAEAARAADCDNGGDLRNDEVSDVG